jgi:hypothetical protein
VRARPADLSVVKGVRDIVWIVLVFVVFEVVVV